MRKEIVPGQLVKSIAGRDSGCYFLVVGTEEGMVKVADGKLRKVQKPKIKNMKHINKYDMVAHEITKKICAGKGVTNGEVSKAIEDLVVGLEC